MPTNTTLGITYPVSTDTVHLTDDLQTLANSVDALLVTDRGKRDTAWTPYTPTIGNVVLGTGGTAVSRYAQYGRLVVFQGSILLGSSGASVSGSITVSLPVTAENSNPHVGTGLATDASVGTGGFRGLFAELNGATSLIFVYGGGGLVNATNPFTFAVNDGLRWEVEYEAVSA